MTIKAKYDGTCSRCGGAISVGDTIDWERGKPARHAECPPELTADNVVRIQSGSGYGCSGWEVGQVIRNPNKGTYYDEDNTQPDYLVVLSARAQYVHDDGLSFGVGDDSGYLYEATCRPATDEEAAPLIAEIEAGKTRKAARKELSELVRQICDTGERPAGTDNDPQGEQLGPGPNAYGGGWWVVITDAEIWYCRNNGSDGDDWSHNNVRTGGAGAIGWRIPVDAEIAQRLRDLVGRAA